MKPKPKLSLQGDLLQKFKFETRKKTVLEKFTQVINQGLAYAQRLVLPEKYVMPCLLGDCDMDKQIQKQRDEYSNLLRKTVPTAPPDELSKKKVSATEKLKNFSKKEKLQNAPNPVASKSADKNQET